MAVVFLESPYSGDIDRNIRYLALCSLDAALLHNECPYASHANMTQHPRAKTMFVSDYDEKWNTVTREQGIELSQRIRLRCDKTVFYTDLGWSSGMYAAKDYCVQRKFPFEERKINIEELSKRVPYCSEEFCNHVLKGDYMKLLE